MIDFYSDEKYQELLRCKRKLQIIITVASVFGVLISILLYLLTTRENQLIMKMLLSVWVIMFLYFDLFVYSELYRNNNKIIQHHLQINKFDEIVLTDFTVNVTSEEYTKNKITFILVDVISNNRKSTYYLIKDCVLQFDLTNCKKLFVRGHYITKIEGGV